VALGGDDALVLHAPRGRPHEKGRHGGFTRWGSALRGVAGFHGGQRSPALSRLRKVDGDEMVTAMQFLSRI
jgi:hypothetical protein